MNDKAVTGSQGEALAADFLVKKGYEIIVRNYRYKHSEIDLIMKHESFIVFVEVKTRTSSWFGEPEAFVDNQKVKKIFQGAEQYTYENKWEGNIRFDVVSVKMGRNPEIVHFEDAFH
jgi:putative endonuclease